MPYLVRVTQFLLAIAASLSTIQPVEAESKVLCEDGYVNIVSHNGKMASLGHASIPCEGARVGSFDLDGDRVDDLVLSQGSDSIVWLAGKMALRPYQLLRVERRDQPNGLLIEKYRVLSPENFTDAFFIVSTKGKVTQSLRAWGGLGFEGEEDYRPTLAELDFDFDGFPDLKLVGSCAGNCSHAVFLFRANVGLYEKRPAISGGFDLLEPDPSTRTVMHRKSLGGAGAFHVFDRLRWRSGKLSLVWTSKQTEVSSPEYGLRRVVRRVETQPAVICDAIRDIGDERWLRFQIGSEKTCIEPTL